jgi:hypothetical protein
VAALAQRLERRHRALRPPAELAGDHEPVRRLDLGRERRVGIDQARQVLARLERPHREHEAGRLRHRGVGLERRRDAEVGDRDLAGGAREAPDELAGGRVGDRDDRRGAADGRAEGCALGQQCAAVGVQVAVEGDHVVDDRDRGDAQEEHRQERVGGEEDFALARGRSRR